MRRCKRCVLPDTVTGVTLDEEGVCSYCRGFKIETTHGANALEKMLSEVRGKGKKYDCVVPVSGGRDSTYVLYMAKAVHGLNPLAVTYDNEFRTDLAIANLERACERLKVDLRTVRSKRDIAQKLTRAGIRSALPLGLRDVIWKLCRACAYGYVAVSFREAEREKAPIVLWGSSRAECTIDLRKHIFARPRLERYLNFLNRNFYLAEYYSLLQRLEFPVRGNNVLSRRIPKLNSPNVREEFYFEYIPWDRRRIKDVIMRELGWEVPPGAVSSWKVDCVLPPFVDYGYTVMVGCTKRCLGFANMINLGKMTREEALAQEEQLVEEVRHGIWEMLEKNVGLTKKEVEIIKSFEADYPARQ